MSKAFAHLAEYDHRAIRPAWILAHDARREASVAAWEIARHAGFRSVASDRAQRRLVAAEIGTRAAQ